MAPALLLCVAAGIVVGAWISVALLRGVIRRRVESRARAWRDQVSADLERQAVAQSEAVLRGRLTEQLVPLTAHFPFEPADARFLGSPVDFVVFDGYADAVAGRADRLEAIVFVDVKTGNARLSTVQRRIRDCVEAGRVRYVEIEAR